MCPLPLCCPNDSQKCEFKNNEHRRNTEKKYKEKTFNLKRRYWLIPFSQKDNIHNFWIVFLL